VLNYLARRIPAALLTVWGASVLIFVLMKMAPGSPAAVLAGPDADAATLAAISHQLGLDRSPAVQYFGWLKGIASGNLGDSLIFHQPISTLITASFGSTLQLAIAATLLMCAIGIGLGVLGGASRSARLRGTLDTVFSIFLALPTYVTAVLALIAFGVVFPNFLPISGAGDFTQDPGYALKALVLPSIALAIPHSAVVGRLLQSKMREQAREDYVRAAKAKGLSNARIVGVHVLRNSLSTAIVVIGIRFGGLLGGAVLIEALFARNGLGQLLTTSILNRDYYIVQDLVLFSVCVAIIMQLLSEVILASIDPRVRLT
jgi:peptide/nickel transport system permease protein